MDFTILNIKKSTFSAFFGLLPIAYISTGIYLLGTGWENTIKDMKAAVNSFFIGYKLKI
jgi:hypothetical protein